MLKLKKQLNRAFTIVELVIVIAVVAALAAILIPTFINVVDSANNSADEQAVYNMNIALAADENLNGESTTLCRVWQVLEDAGYNSTQTASYSDNQFYWYQNANRIVIYNTSSQCVTFPAEYEGLTLTGTQASVSSENTAGKSVVSSVKTATSANTNNSEAVFLALDTDGDLASVHDFEGSTCAVCHKDRAVSAGANSDISEVISKNGWLSLSEDITVSTTINNLLTDSELEDINIDLGDNSLTLSQSLQVTNWVCTYVTEENSAEYASYPIGWVINQKTVPLDVTISGGEILCSSSGYLRINCSNNVVIEDVTFTSSDSSTVRAIYACNSASAKSENTYTFKNCKFENTYVSFDGTSGDIYEYNVIFENCEFSGTPGNGSGCVVFGKFVYGTAIFNNCTFNVTGKNNTPAAIHVDANSNVGENKLAITLNNTTFVGTPLYSYAASSYYNNKFPVVVNSNKYYTVTETGTNNYYLKYDNDLYTFTGYSSITSITVPDTVTSIPKNAFCGLTSLASITLGAKVSSIGAYVFYRTSLTDIKVSSSNTTYKAVNGNLYSYDGTKLVQYAVGKTDTEFSVPDGVTAIGAYAFASNTNLTTVDLNAVTEIDEYAFYSDSKGMSALTSINIPNSVTTIEQYAFYYCDKVETLSIGSSVTSIGDFAFASCTTISSIVIPDSVETIGQYAFSKCTALTTVIIGSGVKSIATRAFNGCSNLTSVTFATTTGWWYADSNTAKSGTELSSSDLSVASTAATYLKSTYYTKYWFRT